MPKPAPIVVPPRARERELVAHQVDTLAAEVGKLDAPVSTILYRLGDALRNGRHDETRGFAGAVDPGSVAEILIGRRSAIWGLMEVLRNVLIFAPIGVTWYGLSTASEAYGRELAVNPELVTKPFLLLWEEGFAGVINFSTLALIDASLIALLIALSFVLHLRSDVRDVSTRTRMLLKESEVRSLLGHASSLAGEAEIGDDDSDALVAEMVAEERRIYERAMEREQQLFDLATAISELRQASENLASVAETLRDRSGTGQGEDAQRTLFGRRG